MNLKINFESHIWNFFLECFTIGYDTEISKSQYLTDWFVKYQKRSIKSELNAGINLQRASKFNDAFPQNATTEEIRQNIVAVNIFYKDLSYTLISDVPQQNWIGFVSMCGGIMGGSIIGMSVITLCELLELFLRVLKIIFVKFFEKLGLILAIGSYLKPKKPLI